MKTIKINRYYNKRGNTYAERCKQQCIDIICKKLKINTNPAQNDNFMKHTMNYLAVEKQVKEQYDCNKRIIEFNINI